LHKAWSGTAWAPSTTTWEDLGGSLTFPYPPAAASSGLGHIDVFRQLSNGPPVFVEQRAPTMSAP
jgi:hypothetical protein